MSVVQATCVATMVVSTWWARTAVNAELASFLTVSPNCAKVRPSMSFCFGHNILGTSALKCFCRDLWSFHSLSRVSFRYQWVQALSRTTLRPQVWEHRGVLPVQLHHWLQTVPRRQKLWRWNHNPLSLTLSSRYMIYTWWPLPYADRCQRVWHQPLQPGVRQCLWLLPVLLSPWLPAEWHRWDNVWR